ncbi:MAG: hypothetical protein LUD41_05285 [Phascolarctobacterium sp.]|nr:hypothetical protein [Phascolarctobacterium sp.]
MTNGMRADIIKQMAKVISYTLFTCSESSEDGKNEIMRVPTVIIIPTPAMMHFPALPPGSWKKHFRSLLYKASSKYARKKGM